MIAGFAMLLLLLLPMVVQLLVVVALHTFSHRHVSGSDSDPNNQNDMQIYVRVPLRKRRGLIVTLSYEATRRDARAKRNNAKFAIERKKSNLLQI